MLDRMSTCFEINHPIATCGVFRTNPVVFNCQSLSNRFEKCESNKKNALNNVTSTTYTFFSMGEIASHQ